MWWNGLKVSRNLVILASGTTYENTDSTHNTMEDYVCSLLLGSSVRSTLTAAATHSPQSLVDTELRFNGWRVHGVPFVNLSKNGNKQVTQK